MNHIEPVFKNVEKMTVAFIPMKGAFSQIPATFGKLYTWISKEGYKAQGPAISVYYSLPDQVPEDKLEWELRSRISDSVADKPIDNDGIGVKQLNPVLVVSVMYKGPYEGLEAVYKYLGEWIREHNCEITGPPEELYYNSPEIVGIDELLTEIRIPVGV